VILAIDQGTTGTTCLVVAAGLEVIGRGYAELAQHFPQPGWVEHDPDEILASVEASAAAALADDEHTRPTPHPKLRIAKAREVDPDWLEGLLDWLSQDRIPGDSEVRRDLKRWVPEFQSQVRPRLAAIPKQKAG